MSASPASGALAVVGTTWPVRSLAAVDVERLASIAALPEFEALEYRGAAGQTMTHPEAEAWRRIELFASMVAGAGAAASPRTARTACQSGLPAGGTRWIGKQTGMTARVMSAEPIEGWVVVRYKRAAPFLVHINDWSARFSPAAASPARPAPARSLPSDRRRNESTR